MRVLPYLYFNGHCEEAVEFYRQAVGAEVVTLTRFKDHPGTPTPEGACDKIMHADLRIGGESILASDGQCSGSTDFRGFSLSLATDTDGAAECLFGALSDGGHVQVPLMSTPFASRFGMVADRYGVLWTIAAHEQQHTVAAV
jgi:PhnB protein